MNNETREITKELAELVFKQTNDGKFTRHVCIILDTNTKKKKLIKFIKENNPSFNEINHRSFDIAMSDIQKGTF